jgi:hypothetical protein
MTRTRADVRTALRGAYRVVKRPPTQRLYVRARYKGQARM